MKKESLVRIANREVPFPLAASWAGISRSEDVTERGLVVHCPFEFTHPDQGKAKAFRVFPDHGFCFAEWKYFTAVSLLALKWDVQWDDAAAEALHRVGYVPATYAHLWDQAREEQEPDRESLAEALREFCRGTCRDWPGRQYDPAVAGRLSRCLALLPLVKTADDCALWLRKCQEVMLSVLT